MAGRNLPNGAHDFDFLHGSWRINNERLTSRLTNSADWESFVAEGACQPILGGVGNIDDFRPRSFGCQLTPPVLGRFEDGEGEFYGEDVHDGTPVRVRFRWTDNTPSTARWEQAFSVDSGKTWETNWTMAFSRDETR